MRSESLQTTESREYSRRQRDLLGVRDEAKSRSMRLIKWMRSGAKVLFVVVLAGMLATSALACPLWIGWMSQGDMPCSKPGSPERCPNSICQLSSPYLTSHVSAHLPTLEELGPVVVDSSHALLTHLGSFEAGRSDDGAPPGPAGRLFLLTHSLLI